MAEIKIFPKRPLPIRITASPVTALAVALKELHDDADSLTCVAGAMVMTDRLSDLGFEVVQRLDLPVQPLNGG